MSLSALQLNRLLQRHLPGELGEHLIPGITWRIGKRRVTAVVLNPIWEDCFQRFAAPVLGKRIQDAGQQLHVICQEDVSSSSGDGSASFAAFLRDPGNEFALAACRRVVESPGTEHNPLYLHGPGGCGKSHLLGAIAGEYRDMLGEESVVVFQGNDFVNRDAHQLAERRSSPLRQRVEQAALIVLDGIESLSRRSMAQEELFHLLNNCLDIGQQVVVAGQSPPQRLAHMEERLTTRLAWGLAVGLDIPQVETRIALLRRCAGTAIDDIDQAELPRIVERQCPDMHAIVTLGERIRRGEDIGDQEDASFDRILTVVAQTAGLRPADIIGKRRSRAIAQARQTALLLARRLTGHKLESLGALVGGRDHSTVIYSLRQAEERAEQDSGYAESLRAMTQRILGKG